MGQVISRFQQVKRLPDFVDAGGQSQAFRSIITEVESGPRPTDYFVDPRDGVAKLFGVNNTTGAISTSLDMGDTWTEVVASTFGGIIRIAPTSDGEVIVVTGDTARKSSGWSSNPATATWSSKATRTSANASFLRWGFDGDGTKFILAEYGSPPDEWQDSRKCYISTDAGTTFTVKYDTEIEHGVTANNESHIHAACYDAVADRFLLTEGHGPAEGLYYSDDDGDTWTKVTGFIPVGGTPTVMVACENGIVLGTDSEPGGVWLWPRSETPTTTDAVPLWLWRNPTNSDALIGFALRGFTDPVTGIIYIGFTAAHAIPCPIVATDGRSANVVAYLGGANGDRVENVIVAQGKVACFYMASGNTVARHMFAECVTAQIAPHISSNDDGRLFGGTASKPSSMAIGNAATTGTLIHSMAIGAGASTSGAIDESFAIGPAAITSASRTILVGYNVTCGSPSSVQIGHGTTSGGAFSTICGIDATGSIAGATCLGYGASGNGPEAVAIGAYAASGTNQSTLVGYNANANSSGIKSTGVGNRIVVSGENASGVGQGATVAAWNSIAVGCIASVDSTATGSGAFGVDAQVLSGHTGTFVFGLSGRSTAANQMQFGARHIELAAISDPAAPAANNARPFVRLNGSSKMEYCVRFPTGAVQIIATEP